MVIIIFFILHWYMSLFFQSFFNHRYAAHGQFTMSPFWEKTFYVFSYIFNGSAFLSPYVYGVMHRMHHAYADQEKDPHSPKFSKNPFDMMWKTKTFYTKVWFKRVPIEKRFTDGVPSWPWLDNLGESNASRLIWVGIYAVFFAFFVTAWWQWLLFPIVVVMGPFHGMIINWFAHKLGYVNFKVSDTSKNFLPVDLLMWGESYHNNHHKRPDSANFGYKWWELDPMYPIIKVMDWVGIIRLKKVKKTEGSSRKIRFSKADIAAIQSGFTKLNLSAPNISFNADEKFRQSLEAWDAFVKADWKGDLSDYLKSLQVRKELQIFLENANGNLKERLNSVVEPLDRKFQARMKPWKSDIAGKIQNLKNSPYFWESNSIYQLA